MRSLIAATATATATATAAAVVAGLLRRRYLYWGATDDEMTMALPGDELLRRADLTATRAITIRATAEGIWPWAGPARTRPWRLLQL
jgi:hypothetical protein